MSSLFVKTLREDPADAEVDSHKLLVRAGYIRRVAPGVYTWLPLGLRVLRKVEEIIRQELDASGAQEMLFPALLPREPYEATNRWEEYGDNLFRLKDRRDNDYLLAPTHEEMFTLAVKDMYSSYKDLPLNLYQFQTKYRDEARPRAGLLRGREFVMKDAYSFDIDQAGLDTSYQIMRDAYERVFDRLGLPYVICTATSGAMGGSRSEEFLSPIAIGEDTFVVSEGGYAANTEAVTTPAPEPIDFSGVPEASVIDTPQAGTIAALVDFVNESQPREPRWQASDMLKNVVVVANYPDRRELLVIGVPGDREVDLKRIEANLAPAEIEMASAADLADYPHIVPGFIGPMQLGPNGDDSVRYLLDAHIAPGSSWITGADAVDKHIINCVYGRDFEASGTIEAVEVREGDLAPDGSGPLRIERGMEIGHIFQLGTKYAEALDLTVLDQDGKARVVTMGSYGIGVSRAVAALAELNHDEAGLTWPAHVAPATVHVLATGKDPAVFETAEQIARQLGDSGVEVIYDDRQKVSAGVKFADFELIGLPYAVVVGRGLESGKVEIRDRRAGERFEVALEDAVAQVTQLL